MAIEEKKVWDILKKVLDPEIGLNLVDLGLIYGVNVSDDDKIDIQMTLTTPGCPLHATLSEQVSSLVQSLGAKSVKVNLVWDPPWNPDMITAEGKKFLGYKG